MTTRETEAESRAAAEVFHGGGELGALCRQMRWTETPLGPVEDWPASLRTVAGLVVASPTPMIVLWGPQLVQIYNDGYREVMGEKHPAGLGQPTHECWPEAREFSAPVYEAVMERGEPLTFEDQRLVLERHGYPEEVFFTLAYSAAPDGSGGVGGVLVSVFETTHHVRGRQARQEGERLGAELEDERARRALALEAGQLGDWELDLRTQDSPRRSPRHDEIFGYTPPRLDWSFEIFLEHVHPADREEVRLTFQSAVEQGAPWDFECRITRADGELRWIWARGGSYRDAEGNPLRMLGIVADITERKRAEEALRRYAQQLRGLADAAVAIHAVRDVGEMLDVITKQARSLIGAHQAITRMAANQNWAQAINSVVLSDKYAAWRDYDEMPDGSGIYHLVAQMNRPMRMTQEELEAHPAWRGFGKHAAEHPPMRGWLAVPLVARDGRNFGLIQLSDRYEGEFTEADEAILVQLAHMAAIAVENARLFRDAQQANQAKAEFLAAMSHELRTPLNAVGGYVELLEMGIHGPLTDAQKESLARIAANQRHLLTLINDILSFVRLEAGRIEFDLRSLSAQEMLSSLEALVSPQAEAKGIAYTVERCEPTLCLRGDAERVRQILLNLVSNAVKYTPEGGWVILSCKAVEEWVDLRVRDSGVGIPPQEQERIFDPFQQVGRRLNQPQEGVGLGLAISRDLARAMAGDLTVESTPGKGSTFTLRLPLVRQE
jgi:PAS domain S-box-containing protein